MQVTPNFDKPLHLSSFVLYRNSEDVQFPDKRKPLHNGPFKVIDKQRMTFYHKKEETLRAHRDQSIPPYPKKSPDLQSDNEQNPVKTYGSDISDMIQNELYTSNGTYEQDNKVFDDHPI